MILCKGAIVSSNKGFLARNADQFFFLPTGRYGCLLRTFAKNSFELVHRRSLPTVLLFILSWKGTPKVSRTICGLMLEEEVGIWRENPERTHFQLTADLSHTCTAL